MPSNSTKIKMDGVGDCEICIPHNDNKHCRRYYPITITTFEIKEKE
jgi:hypothetical protein